MRSHLCVGEGTALAAIVIYSTANSIPKWPYQFPLPPAVYGAAIVRSLILTSVAVNKACSHMSGNFFLLPPNQLQGKVAFTAPEETVSISIGKNVTQLSYLS